MKDSKQDLLSKCSDLGIKVNKSMSIKTLNEKIGEHLELSKSMNIIPSNGRNIEYVYHLADIHIRYLDRHEEYKEVFSRLIEYISKDPNRESSVMVICGDIFHNKDRFVSETIIIFDNFLKEMSKLLDVFIILGNHDCFNHKDRLDALSGIMQVKDYEGVHLLKKSGIYSFGNLIFGVSSILDGTIVTCPPKSEPKTYIGLYHGIVSGCSLDNEYKTNGVSLQNFEKYDIVMLGDVHKRQFLNKEETIAYPGSLIQQSFKEEIQHGFLLWNLREKKSSFVCLDNDYAFIDLHLHEDIHSVDFPKYTRLRILMELEDLESDLKDFVEGVSSKTKVLSVKTIFKERILTPKEKQEAEEKSSLEMREKNIIETLVKPEDLEKILEIHNSLHDKIENADMNYKNTLPWIIKEIEFMNIFCYGGDVLNKIVLNTGITGILAANASGKTNILNTILYGLFGNIYTRNQNQNNRNIISRHSRKNELYVKLTIEMSNGGIYFIERKAKNKKRGEVYLPTETVDFRNQDKILNLTTKVETEKLIRETLSFSTKDDFILTNMISNISYGSNISIVSMNGAQLDEIFNNMFNLNKYKLLNSEAKTLCKKLSQEKVGYEAQSDLIKKKLDFDVQKERKNLSEMEEELKKKKNKKEELMEELEELFEKISKVNKKTAAVKESKELLISKIRENKELLQKEDMKTHVSSETFYETECERLSKLLKNSDLKDFLKSKKVASSLERDISEIEKEISFYEGKKQQVSFSADITEDYIKAKKAISSYKKKDKLDLGVIKETIKNMKYIDKMKHYALKSEERESLLRDLDKTYINNEDFSRYRKIIEDKEKRDLIIKENIEIQQTLSQLKMELKNNKINYAHKLKDTVTKYTDYLELVDLYYETEELEEKVRILDNNEDYSKLVKEKEELTTEMNEVSNQITEISSEVSISKSKIKNYEENMSLKEDLQIKIKELELEIQHYKTYIVVTHSKNLPKHLITNIIKNICIDANNLIFNLCGLICEIKETDKWEIVIKKHNIEVGPEHCSGYERFVINTSLKIAFDRFKQLPTIKLFLIDEVIDCVSEDNFDQIDVLLEHLKKHYSNVFLISHNEELKKKVEHRIDIKIENNCSYIQT